MQPLGASHPLLKRAVSAKNSANPNQQRHRDPHHRRSVMIGAEGEVRARSGVQQRVDDHQ